MESLPSLGQREDVETEESECVSPSRRAPGRVCVEDRAQLWAGAPQGALCRELGVCDECVLGYYKCVFCLYVNVVFAIIGVHLFLKCLPIKQTYTRNTDAF